MDIGKRIAFFKTAKQSTVNKLATKAGISQSDLHDVELSIFNDGAQTSLMDSPLLSKNDFPPRP